MAALGATEPTLSQRELRNESGRVLRAVSGGESFVIANGGVPVARIIPIDQQDPGLKVTRKARRRGGWLTLGIERKHAAQNLSRTLDELREDRI